MRITCRPLPKSSPGHSKKASCRKIHQKAFSNRFWAGIWGAMDPLGGTWRPQGGQWAPKCLPNASQIHRKMTSSVQPPPAYHQTHHLAPKRLHNRRKIDLKAPPALVEKFAIVAPFKGQDHRCVRGTRGKIRDSGPLTRPTHRKSCRKHVFFQPLTLSCRSSCRNSCRNFAAHWSLATTSCTVPRSARPQRHGGGSGRRPYI